MLSTWYTFLWYVYFKQNASLFDFVSQFSTFTDAFSRGAINCQADVIAEFVEKGLESFEGEANRFLAYFNNDLSSTSIRIVDGDLLTYTGNMIAHQVNCKGVMGAGVAKVLRNQFPSIYPHYKNLCDKTNPLGMSQPIQVGPNSYVVNLFGQDTYGRTGVHTNVFKLKEAFSSMQDFAVAKGINEVAMPYGIGAGLAGGDWNEIYSAIQEVFTKINVLLYKL